MVVIILEITIILRFSQLVLIFPMLVEVMQVSMVQAKVILLLELVLLQSFTGIISLTLRHHFLLVKSLQKPTLTIRTR